jgi:FkbM family methyltransferase
MLIDKNKVFSIIKNYNIEINGVLHIGAHNCEELPFYNDIMKIPSENIIWIDALKDKVDKAKVRNIPNVYQAVITDKDNEIVKFHVSNNVQSSSVLDFGTHAKNHKSVKFVRDIELKTTTVDTFFENIQIDSQKYDFWNFDIQGAEMLALIGAKKSLQYVKCLYLEVNTEEVYKGCAILKDLDKFLEDIGFKRVETVMTGNGWGDALFLRIV